MEEGLGGGEMAAHDTRIVSHSAAVSPTDVAMGALNIIYHFLFQERLFVGYTAMLCAATSELAFLPLPPGESWGEGSLSRTDAVLC